MKTTKCKCFILGCVLLACCFKTLVSNAFIVSAHHDDRYVLRVYLYDEVHKCWHEQLFSPKTEHLTTNVQFFGMHVYHGQIFYLVYDMMERAMRVLSHSVVPLQQNEHVSKEEKMQHLVLHSLEGWGGIDTDYFNKAKMHTGKPHFKISGTSKKKGHVVIYDEGARSHHPVSIPLSNRGHKLTLVRNYAGYDESIQDSIGDYQVVSVGLFHDTVYVARKNAQEHYFLAKGSLSKKALEKQRRAPIQHQGTTLLSEPQLTLDRVRVEDTDIRYSEPHILYFDKQKKVHASLGPIMAYLPDSYDTIHTGVMGFMYDNRNDWKSDHSRVIPYSSLLNKSKKDYNFISLDQGFIGMFTNNFGQAAIYSVIDEHNKTFPIVPNEGEKRSKLLLGDDDGDRRYIAVNNSNVYSSKNGMDWNEWNTLPYTGRFQDVVWVAPTKRKR